MQNTTNGAASITELLEISAGSVLAVVGCGGKTSLIALLAGKLRGGKVLVSPTTKMFPLEGPDIILRETLRQCEEHVPRPGVQCLGVRAAAGGKLASLPESLLAKMVPRYDAVLLEADGSRALPCKGWLADEPVVPPYCTHTVGVVTLRVLGEPAAENRVLRLPEFLSLTGLCAGEEITPAALTAMVCAPGGMFRRSAGRRYLLVNQVEDEATARAARSFLLGIKEAYPNTFARTLYGSVWLDTWWDV